MCRCLILTFFGDEFRGWTIGRPSQLPSSKHDAHDADHEDDDDGHHAHEDLSQPSYPPRESPRAMTIPLLILAVAAIVGGIFNPGAIKLVMEKFDSLPLEHWLDPVFADARRGITVLDHHEAHSRELTSLVGALMALTVGALGAYWVYVKEKGKPAREMMLRVPGLYRWALEKWHVDEFFYDKTVVSGVDALADTAASVNQGIVDFIIARLTALIVAAAGTILRVIQNGVVHVYAAMMVVGLVGLGWFFVEPHADFTVNEQAGDYTLVAGPGPNYSFRWYPDSTKDPQSPDWNAVNQLKVHVADGKTQTVKLEVKNAFGRSAPSSSQSHAPRRPPRRPPKVTQL